VVVDDRVLVVEAGLVVSTLDIPSVTAWAGFLGIELV